MFRKILIATRGEIAVRIVRACREVGVTASCVYTRDDLCSLHVRLAHECHALDGPGGYADGEQILAIARRWGAEAIHPGCGPLAGRADFAQACRQSGAAWIGPPVEAAARLEDRQGLLAAARRAGYAVIEAAAVHKEGGAEGWRNVDVQVLGDAHGRWIHLGERQRLVTAQGKTLFAETPAPRWDAEQRHACYKTAVELARRFQVTGPVTVEFLVDQAGGFYFNGMKAWIDPLHPLVEMTASIDLAREQIWLATGDSLIYRQGDIRPDGVAMSCCIEVAGQDGGEEDYCARLELLQLAAGIGVRVDTYVLAGGGVLPEGEPTIARITVHSPERATALARMRRALEECQVRGICTNLQWLKSFVDSPEAAEGNYPAFESATAGESLAPRESESDSTEHKLDIAAMAAILYTRRKQGGAFDPPEIDEHKRRR